MSESRDQLVARRDALIEQLQGEWAVDVDKRSINRKAILAALISMAATAVFFAVVAPVMFLTHSDPNQSMDFSFIELLVGFGGLDLVVGAVFYVYIWGHAFWYRRLNPIVIDENRLLWNKRKGYVPERLDLLNVTSVSRYDGTGSSRFLMSLINRLERSSTTSLSPVMFGSMGELNTPKVIPAMFKDGHRFISAIEQIAEINTQLQQMDKTESA